MRTVRCACGGSITAPDTASSQPYVDAHNRMPEHVAWRERGAILEAPRPRLTFAGRALEREKYNRRPAPYCDPRPVAHGEGDDL